MGDIIPEDDVTVKSLNELFRRTFHTTEIDADGDIYVTEGLDMPIWISVDDQQKLIRLFTFTWRDLETNPPFSERSTNFLNRTVALPTFYVDPSQPDRLYSHHFLSFRDGLIDSQFVGLVRRFASASVYGARRLEEHVLH